MIGRFWVVHHRFFAEVKAFDGRLLGLNLLYLAGVFLLSIPLAFVAPSLAPFLWLVLFLDPAGALFSRAAR